MIRRAPTAIQLTTQDVLDYDDQRALKLAQAQAKAQSEQDALLRKENSGSSYNTPGNAHGRAAGHEMTNEEKTKRMIQEREQRMGLNK